MISSDVLMSQISLRVLSLLTSFNLHVMTGQTFLAFYFNRRLSVVSPFVEPHFPHPGGEDGFKMFVLAVVTNNQSEANSYSYVHKSAMCT